MSMKKSCLALLALACIASGQNAVAESGETVSVKVKAYDLNLSTRSGAEEMARRIQTAASRVCWGDDADKIYNYRARVTCMNQAINSALARLGNPTVTALLRGKGEPDLRFASVREDGGR